MLHPQCCTHTLICSKENQCCYLRSHHVDGSFFSGGQWGPCAFTSAPTGCVRLTPVSPHPPLHSTPVLSSPLLASPRLLSPGPCFHTHSENQKWLTICSRVYIQTPTIVIKAFITHKRGWLSLAIRCKQSLFVYFFLFCFCTPATPSQCRQTEVNISSRV